MKELNGIRGSRPVTAAELEVNKQSFIRRFPAGFETVGGISGQLANLVTYSLPDSYFNDYIAKINAVTEADVNRVANKYLDPSKMAIVIVGDRKVVEPGLKELGWPLFYLDADGNVVSQYVLNRQSIALTGGMSKSPSKIHSLNPPLLRHFPALISACQKPNV